MCANAWKKPCRPIFLRSASTGSESEKLNKQLGAKAFTHGQDIFFDKGQYNPSSKTGTHLLAHELTHVLQQKGGQSLIQRRNGDDDGAAGASAGEETEGSRARLMPLAWYRSGNAHPIFSSAVALASISNKLRALPRPMPGCVRQSAP
ncbi:MAG: DUF4157 domain-containing protein [Bacteroidia bacterium]